ncbi:hypothetical protein ACQPYK_48575 (plasmid) [Streptosporangium sp. CA-135522]|uniref:hypothetical protein n=1 Tax=Streptosporangium sp. CA-135522 TaxID=3240072 RepID=UPI003D8E4B72
MHTRTCGWISPDAPAAAYPDIWPDRSDDLVALLAAMCLGGSGGCWIAPEYNA